MNTSNQSFNQLEHETIHTFREQVNLAENTADLRKVFARTAQGILLKVFDNKLDIKVDDIVLTPGQEPGYALNETVLCNEDFKKIWLASDLPQIIGRFAESASHRFKYLEKHHEHTRSKIGRH